MKVLNKFPELRKKPNPNLRFKTPAELIKVARAYFEWVQNNPITVEKLFHYQGDVKRVNTERPRPATIRGLCLHGGFGQSLFNDMLDREDMSLTCQQIENACYEWNLAHASAETMNPNVITRLLGLSEKTEILGGSGVVPVTITVNPVKSVKDKQGNLIEHDKSKH